MREDGTVKVLDFGLAKALAPPASTLEGSAASTITSPAMTQRGAILGTAAYMSPEQARGKPADKRADVWAFGVVLYEMTTGRRPFEGETVSESLASVMKSEPDWTHVPPELRRLLRSCLEKDPKKRLRDIGDWQRQLDDPKDARPGARNRSWPAWSVAAVLAIALGVLAALHFRESAPLAAPITFQILAPATNTFMTGLSVSRDGRRVAFTAMGADKVTRVWVRDLELLNARPVAGTEGTVGSSWSPDGRSLAFRVGRAVKRVAIDGGQVLTIFEAASADMVGSSSWSQDGSVIVGGARSGVIRRVSESGGVVTPLTAIDVSRRELAHSLPAFLPDGRHFLYTRVAVDETVAGVYIGSIDRKPEEQDETRLLAAAHVVYAVTRGGAGHLLYLRQGTLVAHPFDAPRLALVGEPVPVAEGVGNTGPLGFFSAGAGVIAYRTGARTAVGAVSQLTWVDREGKPSGVVASPNTFDEISLSPDGAKAAVVLGGLVDVGLGNFDIWVVDLARGVSQRLTTHAAVDRAPVWSTAGDRLAFFSVRAAVADLYTTSSNGTGESLLLKSDQGKIPTSWSRDGRFLLYSARDPKTASDIWLLPLGGDRKPVPLVQTEFAESEARFSPDMRWIAYTSFRSWRAEIPVQPFNALSPGSSPGEATVVSKDGGRQARWRQDGRELIFQAADGSMVAVGLTIDKQLHAGAPTKLFVPAGLYWDVTADGQRFLVTMPPADAGLAPITVMMNWK